MQLGLQLKAARKHLKLTQTDVAMRLGLSQNRVSYLEQHPAEMSVRQLFAWSAAVGLRLSLGERDKAVSFTDAEW